MKTITKFIVAAMMFFAIMPVLQAQETKLLDPSEAEYSIRGTYEKKKVNGKIVYRLLNPTSTRNITFDMPTSGYIEGYPVSDGYIAFPFENANTTYPGNFENNKLNYWYRAKEDSRWYIESEVQQGVPIYEETKQMEIMLVLDCSSSIDEDFDDVKSSAINFINQLYEKTNGNVRVGVIGFSTIERTQTISPRKLDNSNKNDIISQIRGFRMANGTALYYSMNKAIDMMQKDVRDNILQDEYNGAYLIAFTDGIDNISVDDANDILDADAFYTFLQKRTVGINIARIYGIDIEPWIVSVRGKDITNENRARLVRDQFDKLVPPKHHKPMNNIRELNRTFGEICEALIKRNTKLICYVPNARQGEVGWTFDERVKSTPKPEPIPAPTPSSRSPWFGISLELGVYGGFFRGLNLDMAFSLNKTFAIGGRIGLFYSSYLYTEVVSREEPYYDTYWNGYYWQEYVAGYNTYDAYYDYSTSTFGFLIGPEIKLTSPKDNAFIVGLGGGMIADEETFYLRTGYKTKKSFFFTADMLFGEYVGIGIGAGFSFGGKLRKH